MKKVLFININFYQYDERIADAIRKSGYDVDMFCHQAPATYFSRVIQKINPDSFHKRNYSHQRKFLNDCTKNQYNIIFVIVGRYLTEEFLSDLKKKNSSAKFILYLWDDIARVENFEACSKFYDKIYTFDPVDSINYGYELITNFYTDDFSSIEQKNNSVFFSGSFHSDRVKVMNKILPQLNSVEKDFHLLTTRYQSFKHDFGGMKPYLRFSQIPLNENCRRMERSIAAIDITHPTQSGLSFRPFEAIKSKTKLITTNEQIKNCDFYNPDNILIIDRNNPIVPKSFFQLPYHDIDCEIKQKYMLKNWISQIFR